MSDKQQQHAEIPPWVFEARAKLAAVRVGVKAPKLAQSTLEEYERRAARLAKGEVVLAGVCTRELALWKAAGKWAMAKRVREAMNAADAVWKDKSLTHKEKLKKYRVACTEVWAREEQRKQWSLDVADVHAAKGKDVIKKQHHKKRALNDEELDLLFEAIGKSSIRVHALVAEFCGVRPQEFEQGVKLSVHKDGNGNGGILFSVAKRAKKRDGCGLATGEIFVSMASITGKGRLRRFRELLTLMKEHGGVYTAQMSPTENQTTGKRLTQSIRCFARKAFPDAKGSDLPSFYSFRQGFSQAVKRAASIEHPGDPSLAACSVADALGHVSTETGRYYQRGSSKAGFAPKSVRKGGPDPSIRDYDAGLGPKGRAVVRNTRAIAKEKAMIAAGILPPRPTLAPKRSL